MNHKRISATRILRTFLMRRHHYVLSTHRWGQDGWFTVEICDENGRMWLDSYNRHALKEMRRKNRKLLSVDTPPKGW